MDGGGELARVMSPSRVDLSPNMGLLLGISVPCPQCGTNAAEPLTCSSCGRYGHAHCLQAEWFMSLPFCGSCLRRVIADYGVQHDRAMREQWRDYHVQQLTRWKSLAMDAVGISSAIGAAIAGTTSVIVGAAAGLARGAVTAARGAGQVLLFLF